MTKNNYFSMIRYRFVSLLLNKQGVVVYWSGFGESLDKRDYSYIYLPISMKEEERGISGGMIFREKGLKRKKRRTKRKKKREKQTPKLTTKRTE